MKNIENMLVPPAKWDERTYFGYMQKKPVIYEYAVSGDREKNLTYPVQPVNRHYYEVGDVIDIGRVKPHTLYFEFPELRLPTSEHEVGLFQLVYSILSGPPDDFLVGLKIKSIAPSINKPGDGRLYFVKVLILDAETQIELGTQRSQHQVVLSAGWKARILANGTYLMGNFLAEAVGAFTGGGARLLSQYGGRKVFSVSLTEAMRRTGKRALVRRLWLLLKKDFTAYSANAMKAFATTFVKEVSKGQNIETIGKLAQQDGAKFEREIAKPAAAKAIAAFLTTLITDVISDKVSKTVRAGVQSEIQQELLTRIFKGKTSGPLVILVNSVADAYADAQNSSKSFDELLAGKVQNQMIARLKELVKLDIGQLMKA